MKNISETMVCKRLCATQQKTMMPERWETNEVNSIIDPNYYLEGFLGSSIERGNPGGGQRILS